MITAEEIKVLDKNAEFYNTAPEKLMESAGKHVAQYIDKNLKSKHILIFCGVGNNGGDGFVAARHLAKKFSVTVFLVGTEKDIKTTISRMNFKKLAQNPLKIYDERSMDKLPELIQKSNVVVDAMLGIGLSGELRAPFDYIVDLINQHKNQTDVVAVDVPTGIGMNIAVKPEVTITFHDVKKGMNETNCGEIIIVDIGIPLKAQQYVGPGELSVYYPHPKKQSHKGENGRVLIIGGGPFSGAPALSGLAALRTGADLVYVAAPKYSANIISAFSPNLIVKGLHKPKMMTKDDITTITEMLSRVDSIVLGPGLGSSYDTAEAVRTLVPHIVQKDIPLVIDADALKATTEIRDSLKDSKTIVTPHAMEFAAFTGSEISSELNERIDMVSQWAKKLGISIFLKGPTDILSNGQITKLNDVHNPAMTVGGTGDVLAGIIGGLLAKKTSLMNAMRIAAFLNGKAGNLVFSKKSYGLVATDIIEELPMVLKKYL